MAGPSDKQSIIDAATKYLDGLVKHDGTEVPLAADCWRTELGKNAGIGADQIRSAIDAEPVLEGYRDLRWWVDGSDAIAFYLMDASGATAHIAERFRVIDGQIHEIEAIFHIAMAARQDRWPIDESQVWTASDAPAGEDPVRPSDGRP